MPIKKMKRAIEKDLKGLWFRCEQGHLTDNPIYLAHLIYCPNDDCAATTKVVHSVADDKKAMTPSEWNLGI